MDTSTVRNGNSPAAGSFLIRRVEDVSLEAPEIFERAAYRVHRTRGAKVVTTAPRGRPCECHPARRLQNHVVGIVVELGSSQEMGQEAGSDDAVDEQVAAAESETAGRASYRLGDGLVRVNGSRYLAILQQPA